MATTYTFPPDLCEDPVRISDLLDERTPDELQPIYKARADTVHDVLSLGLVCREWNTIVAPFLLDWMLITADQQLRHLSDNEILTKSVGYRLRGSWVRRLEIVAGDTNDGSHIFAIQGWLIAILEACTRLEELISRCGLIYAGVDIISALVAHCGKTLRSITLPGPFAIRDEEIVTALLDGCPRLTTLQFAGPSNFADSLAKVPAGPLALRAFLWQLTTDVQFIPLSGFPTYFCALDLPDLRHVDLAFDDGYEWTEDFDTTVLPPIITALRGHRNNLTSLRLKEQYRNIGTGLVAHLLELCPNIEDLEFDIASSNIGAVTVPHPSLRRVRCNKFVILPDDEEAGDHVLDDHFSNVMATIHEFSRENFPKLERIRFMDIDPFDGATRPSGSALHLNAFYAFYCEMTKHLAAVCSERGVRFEDRCGNVVGEEFSLPEWFYDMVADEQWDPSNGQTS